MLNTFRCAATASLLVAVAQVQAHTAWFEPQPSTPGNFVLLFGGHAGALLSYPVEKVKSIGAVGTLGQAMAVTRNNTEQGVVVGVTPAVAMLTVHFDNGFFSRGPDGKTVPQPMHAVPGATKGTWAIKWGKTIVRWDPVVMKPAGQPFELVPLDAPKPNRPMRLQVLIDGQPTPGITVARDENGDGAVKTDAQGIASFTPKAGWNRAWSGQRTPVAGERDYNERSVEVMLVFEARP
jgi:nickel transport protein